VDVLGHGYIYTFQGNMNFKNINERKNNFFINQDSVGYIGGGDEV
jgi:hypothetical protein